MMLVIIGWTSISCIRFPVFRDVSMAADNNVAKFAFTLVSLAKPLGSMPVDTSSIFVSFET